MKNMFSYDSKLMSVLSFIGDLFILNVLYLLCSVPVFTIGAAQAGLHTAVRVLQDPMDGRSPVKAFFRGFKAGFGRITLAWLLFFVFDIILYFTLYMTFTYADTGLLIHWGVPLVGVCISLVYQTVLGLFHSQFSCTFPQLLRNCALMCVWHPLASVLSGVLMCAPMIMFLLIPAIFVQITPLFLTVYFSLAALLIYLLTQKAFKALIDNFNNPEDPEAKEEEPAAEE